MKRLGYLALAMALLTICGPLLGDTLYLEDGRTIQGKVISPPGAPTVKIDTPAGEQQFAASMIREIKLGEHAHLQGQHHAEEGTRVRGHMRRAVRHGRV
jgi:hypothetical protein